MGQILTGRRSATAWLIAITTLGAALLLSAPASARTVTYTLHVPAMVVDNLCNGEPVVFSGDLHIRETTTPARNGGYTVQSSTNARNLHGPGLVTGVQYTGQDTENTFAYYAAPPFPSSFSVVHWTRLESHGPVPNMYLVMVLRETIAPDGTAVPTLERMYLTCRQPHCSATKNG